MKVVLTITLTHESPRFIIDRDVSKDPANGTFSDELREYIDLASQAMNQVDDEWARRMKQKKYDVREAE